MIGASRTNAITKDNTDAVLNSIAGVFAFRNPLSFIEFLKIYIPEWVVDNLLLSSPKPSTEEAHNFLYEVLLRFN